MFSEAHVLAMPRSVRHSRRVITGPQIRAARALLGWTAAQLATAAGVSIPTVQRAEAAAGVPTTQATNLAAIQRALEDAGIAFLDPNSTGELPSASADGF
jgi:transcriptional regulator with XRE-family HTH domain